ncbi:MAG TPA: SpoIVB peptidase S55 domain-containing protein [Terriglobia bacterium]|nr:SpoIVB peptidase S55 domain-containing protein [Terriglobia bacterium]
MVARLSVLVLVCSCAAWAQQSTQFFPVSEVRPGMKGVGRTIFEGNQVQEFQVELLGVAKGILAPKHDAILARLSGPTVDKTGVVEGMSGSPVYVNGRLLGAIAVSFPYEKEPYTLITPIEDMLAVTPAGSSGPSAALDLPWYASAVPASTGNIDRWIPQSQPGPQSWADLAAHWASRWAEGAAGGQFRLPLRFSGFDSQVISRYTPVLNAMGFDPMQVATMSSSSAEAESSPEAAAGVTPGTMISLVLVRGDLNLNADCTVTYRNANQLYACGHPVFSLGPAQVPFAPARVLATVPSLAASFKIDVPGPIVGSIRQDRFGAIYGVVGDIAPIIPIHVSVDSSLGRETDYHFEVAQQPVLSPLLVNMAVVSAITSTERVAGPATLDLSGSIDLSDGESIKIEDVDSSELSAAGGAGVAVAGPLSYLLNGQFPSLRIRGINLTVKSQSESRIATLEQVWSTRSEVRPGDHIEVTAVERTPSGATITQTIPVTIPMNVTDKTLSLVVGSGTAMNAVEMRFIRAGSPPRDLHQLVRELNQTRRNNRLYALLMAPQRSFIMEGTDFPSPPPSLLQTFMADPAVSSKITYRVNSVVGDYQTSPVPYSIEGEQTLFLKVLSAAN